ncbi:MAG: serine hydrolase [Hyphomonas sp.]|nr:serine hydrolase [Hyphomonas sp.]MCB9962956.1 serine hydrolase [Hyphomonas sp.]MCB9972305.1 serine hydrolase [Hyphomonas sp.]
MLRNMFVAAIVAVAAALPAAAQGLVPLPPQPDGLAYPTEGWETADMPADTAALVQPLIDKAMAGTKDEVMGETRAVVIIHHGKLVAEAYRDGFGPDTKQISWSMAKSVTSALVGRAVELGLIDDLDTPMPAPFDAGDPRAQITWRQWLTMTDGLDYHEIDAPDLMHDDVVQMMYGRGRFDSLAYVKKELPPAHAPGTVWNYSTAGYHLIGRALQAVFEGALHCRQESGAPCKSTLSADDRKTWTVQYVNSLLFGTLGMDAQIEFDPAGTYLGGSLVWASARDFAKFGYLYLRDGMWTEGRILPEGWVDFSRTDPPQAEGNVYGAGFWITPAANPSHPDQTAHSPPFDAFSAQGHEGQTIWIVPSRDLVIVRLGLMSNAAENWAALYEWNQEIARAFPDVGPEMGAD